MRIEKNLRFLFKRVRRIKKRVSNNITRISGIIAEIVNWDNVVNKPLSLTSGQSGTIFLEISSNGTEWTEVSRFTNGNTGTLTGTPSFNYITGQEIIY